MKILLYGLNFAPEQTGIGKYSGEMAAWLVASGHQVHVVAAPPYYPAWSISPGYSARRTQRSVWNGVQVWRTPLWVPADPTGLKRVLHLLSFALLSLPALFWQVLWKPDVVIVVAPALVCAPGGWLAARLSGARAWLHIQDFEVDAAFRMGLLKGRFAQRAVSAFERLVLRRFDCVSTISSRMLDMLRTKQGDRQRTALFPNWVDTTDITPIARPSPFRAELGLAPGSIVALYSGSLGGKQGLELLPAAARALHERLPQLVFVICGQGVSMPMLERECAGLANVRLMPLQPMARLNDLLGMADIHLLPQQADAADLVMPSKLTGMLASGRPVLATAHPGTELANVVAGHGLVVPPDDLPAFTEALIVLAESSTLRTGMGNAARAYAEKHLSRDRVLAEFEKALKRCIGSAALARHEPNGPHAPRPPLTTPSSVAEKHR